MITDRRTTNQPQAESLTVEQKNIVIDYFAEGKDYPEIKHLMKALFEAGTSFGHLIKDYLQELKTYEPICTAIMSDSIEAVAVPKTQVELKASMVTQFSNDDKTCVEHFVDKVMEINGDWTAYAATFS